MEDSQPKIIRVNDTLRLTIIMLGIMGILIILCSTVLLSTNKAVPDGFIAVGSLVGGGLCTLLNTSSHKNGA
jgi:hypothetical protein